MAGDDDKAVVRRMMEEVCVEGKLDLIDELVTPDYVGHSTGAGEPIEGPEALKMFISGYREVFPDLSITIHQQISEGEIVATRITETGTHLGQSGNVPPPNGKRMEVPGMFFARVENGRIKESWSEWDMWAQVKQLGHVEADAARS